MLKKVVAEPERLGYFSSVAAIQRWPTSTPHQKMKTITKSAAIAHAKQSVTLQNCGRQWKVDSYCPKMNAWYQGRMTDYWQARANYSQTLIDKAREFLGLDGAQYDGGKWTSYLD